MGGSAVSAGARLPGYITTGVSILQTISIRWLYGSGHAHPPSW